MPYVLIYGRDGAAGDAICWTGPYDSPEEARLDFSSKLSASYGGCMIVEQSGAMPYIDLETGIPRGMVFEVIS